MPDDQHVIIEDEVLAAGFTQIPNQVLRRSDLQPGAKLTYMVLLSYAWQKDHAYPGQERLAGDMGVSERSVITYLKQLQDSGLVTVRRRGLGMTNVYVLHRISRSENIAVQGGSEKSALPEVKKPTPQEVQDLPSKKTKVNKTQSENMGFETSNGTPTVYDAARESLIGIVQDFALEFRDTAPLPSTLTRVVRLYRASGLDLDTFVEQLYRARQITKERTSSIRSGEPGQRQMIPYFLKVLEQLNDPSSTKTG